MEYKKCFVKTCNNNSTYVGTVQRKFWVSHLVFLDRRDRFFCILFITINAKVLSFARF